MSILTAEQKNHATELMCQGKPEKVVEYLVDEYCQGKTEEFSKGFVEGLMTTYEVCLMTLKYIKGEKNNG